MTPENEVDAADPGAVLLGRCRGLPALSPTMPRGPSMWALMAWPPSPLLSPGSWATFEGGPAFGQGGVHITGDGPDDPVVSIVRRGCSRRRDVDGVVVGHQMPSAWRRLASIAGPPSPPKRLLWLCRPRGTVRAAPIPLGCRRRSCDLVVPAVGDVEGVDPVFLGHEDRLRSVEGDVLGQTSGVGVGVHLPAVFLPAGPPCPPMWR